MNFGIDIQRHSNYGDINRWEIVIIGLIEFIGYASVIL
jgi:hypothetical protein